MAGKRISVARLEEIKRLIDQGLTDREIARSLKCRRFKVAGVRKGLIKIPEVQLTESFALWTYQADGEEILKEVGLKRPMKFIWEEKAKELTSYPNFFRTFYLKFPHVKTGTITLRDFEPGERAEVDWAGGKIEWMAPEMVWLTYPEPILPIANLKFKPAGDCSRSIPEMMPPLSCGLVITVAIQMSS